MSRYDDDYDIDDEDEDYDDYLDGDEDDEDDSPSSRSPLNPYSSGSQRPAAPGSSRYGDSSRLPGSPPPRGPGGPPPPVAPRATGSMPPARPGAPPSSMPSSTGFNRPGPPTATPPGRNPASGPGPGGGASQRGPSSIGSKLDSLIDKPATPRGGPPAKPADKKDDKGGLGGRFNSLTSRITSKDDKPAAPKRDSAGGKPSGAGNLLSRFSGGKDDKPASSGGSSGGLLSGLRGNKDNKPATPKKDSGKGGLLSGLRRGGDKSPAPPRTPGAPGGSPGSSPFGSRVSAPGSPPGPARAQSAPKGARPSLRDRLKNFSLFKKPEPQTSRPKASKAPSVQKPGLSLDTKLDILGVALVLSALALIFSSLSPNQGALTGTINTFLSQNLGWGAPAVPVAMFAAGIWLILRHFGEEAPVLDMVPVIGVVMIYIGLLVAFQYADSFSYELRPGAPPLDQLKNIYLPISYTLGRGGGWIGAEIYYFLVANLTEIGGFFVLLAWLIVGLMLTLSLSAAEMAIIVISIWRSFNDARHRRSERRRAALAEQQALSAAALPGVTVTKPGAEQLPPGVRSPALPAGGLYGDAVSEERSIPITQGGRTVTAPFRAADAVPLERATSQQTPLPVASAPVREADDAKPAGRGSLFGGMSRRGSTPADANGDAKEAPRGGRFGLGGRRDADTNETDADEKNGGLGGRFGGFARSVRTVLPGTDKSDDLPKPDTARPPTPATNGAQAADAESARPTGMGRFAGPLARVREALPGMKPADKPEAEADETLLKPATPKGTLSTSRVEVPAAPTTPAPDEPAKDAPDDESDAPVRLGTLLGKTSSPSVRQPARPLAPQTRMPSAEQAAGPQKPEDEPVDKRADDKPDAAPAAALSADEETTAPADADVADKPAATGQQAPPARPSPFRSPIAPPTFRDEAEDDPDEDDEDEGELLDALDLPDNDEDDDLTPDMLPPARPKGIGPLPRSAAPTPFSRPTPQSRTPAAFPDPSRVPTTSLQERLAALRSGQPLSAQETPSDDAAPAKPPDEPTPPDDTPTERVTSEAPRVDATPEPEETAPAPPEDDDSRPTEPAHRSAPAFESKSVPPPRPGAPAAYRMPERPTPPPPPARGASTAPSTPPIASPPPPAAARAPGRRKVWELPDYGELLANGADQDLNHDQLLERAKIIEETLSSFGAPGRVVEVRTGPVVTQFGVEPDYLPGRGGKKIRVKVSAIAQLDKDLQLALGARSIRIEAPVPGKGYVGIEVPNDKAAVVRLRDVLESHEFTRIKSPLGICLGQGVDGTPVAADLAAMPHLLIAGTTGSGKSVCVNTIIASLLVKNSPDRVKFIMVDPKRVELTGYNGIPHLVAPVVVELERIVGVLKWVTREMDERYKKFSNAGARNIEDFNKHLPAGEQQMPYIVVFIDELADLMMLAPDETERVITRIAALARATGIHLVIATQRPSVDVVTGLIKANFPARIAFAVASNTDSRVILDQPGAERLLGRGDMLYMSGDSPAPQRLQGVYVSDAEINNVTQYWRSQLGPEDHLPKTLATGFLSDSSGPASVTSGWGAKNGTSRTPTEQTAFWDRELRDGADIFDDEDGGDDGEDAMYDEAVELVRQLKKASVSLLQRRLRIGYTRAARLIDIMEERGIIGPPTEGSKPREVLK